MGKIVLISAFALCLSAIPAAAQNSNVSAVQNALKDKGFDPGPIDGIMGPRTRAALRRYQTQNHLKVDGRLDSETQASLGVANAPGEEFKGAGDTLKTDYASGGKAMANGGKALGHDVKHGDIGQGAVAFGKDVGHGVKDVGIGTAHAAKDAAVGTKDALTPKHKENPNHINSTDTNQ
jgi:peptidoglycan hydrolase-like protein with peptidoglycan-binding domain